MNRLISKYSVGGILVGPRGCEKTETLVDVCVDNQDKKILIIGPQQTHCNEIIRRVKDRLLMQCLDVTTRNITTASNRSVNRIYGQRPDIILFDEAAHIDEDVFLAARPMILKGAVFLAVGSPKEIDYSWLPSENRWIAKNWFKRLIDEADLNLYKNVVMRKVGVIVRPEDFSLMERAYTREEFRAEHGVIWNCTYRQ